MVAADFDAAVFGPAPSIEFDVMSAELLVALEDASNAIEDDSGALAQPAVFDPIHAVLRNFGSAGADVRDRACECTLDAVGAIARACKRSLGALASDAELGRQRALLKRAVLLLATLIEQAEKHSAAASAAEPPKTAAAKKAARGGAKKAAALLSCSKWNWEAQREDALLKLLSALELDLPALWSHRSVEEGFSALFLKAACAVLEQPAALKAASNSAKEALARLLVLPALCLGQRAQVGGELVSLLLRHEHLATPLAELLSLVLDESGAPTIVVELIQELSQLSPADMGADAAGPKHVSLFISALAARAPLMLLANLELLQVLLTSDSYTLRCGVVSTNGQLQLQFAKLDAPPPEVAEAAAGLIEVVLERLHDVSSFVRCRALQTLCALCEARALPRAAFREAAEQALGRLEDKNANVRRGALQLYARMLEFNPFCAALDRKKLEGRRRALEASAPPAPPAPQALTPPEPPTSPTSTLATAPASPEAEAETDDGGAAAEPMAADAAAAADALSADPAARERAMALELLDGALAFEAVLSRWLPHVTQLLGSQTTSDVTEAMHALVSAHCFELQGARPAAFLSLVFSREPTIKAAVLQAAQTVWLRPIGVRDADAQRVLSHSLGVARGLLSVVEGASLAELTSLEEVVGEWQRQQLLPSALLQLLWEAVQSHRPEMRDRRHQRGALTILNMVALADGSVARCRMDVLMAQLRPGAHADLEVARLACHAMQICAASGPIPPKALRSLLHSLEELLLREPAAAQERLWFGFAEQAINAVFALATSPQDVCTELLRQMGFAAFPCLSEEDCANAAAATAEGAAEADVVRTSAVSRLLFALGHVAIKMLAHIEECERALSKRRAKDAEAEAEAEAEPETSKKGGRRKKGAPAEEEAAAPDDALADELGTTAAAAEADSEELLALGEALLQPEGMLGGWAPLVSAICANGGGWYPPELRASAVLALCKFMCTSAAFCESQLQLLFTVMQREREVTVRANVAVALGDLAVRHPNLLEPWTAHLYSHLRDADTGVRKTVLMVLTHLILNDMLKVKGQLAEMALCLLDPEPRIVAATQLFFSEFAKKGSSPVYNLLPDIVSSLTANQAVGPAAFREVLGFLIGFIQKERQSELMVEKLCQRFGQSDEPQNHRDIAFCVAALTPNERSIKKLQEHFKTYAAHLGDDEVYGSFASICQKARKFARVELKATIDEYEAQLEASRAGSQPAAADDADSVKPEQDGACAVAPPPKAAGRAKGGGARRASKPAKKKAVSSSEEESEEAEEESDGEQDAEQQQENKSPHRSPNRPQAVARPKAAKAKATEAVKTEAPNTSQSDVRTERAAMRANRRAAAK